jgi:hypothetical protein
VEDLGWLCATVAHNRCLARLSIHHAFVWTCSEACGYSVLTLSADADGCSTSGVRGQRQYAGLWAVNILNDDRMHPLQPTTHHMLFGCTA